MLGVIVIILICLLAIAAISAILNVATESELFMYLAVGSVILFIIGLGAVGILFASTILI